MEEARKNPTIRSSFYLKKLTFESGKLEVSLGLDNEDSDKIVFDYVRSFMFIKESDFYAAFAKYKSELIVSSGKPTCGVFKVTDSAIFEAILPNELRAENPTIYWLSTPDECLEIVSFEKPQVILASCSSALNI